LRTGHRRRARAVAACFAVTLAVGAGCGEDSSSEDEAQALGPVKAGSVAAGAQCRHWNRGTEEEKLATIEDIRSQINLEDAPVESYALTDEQAFELFEHACAEDYAASLKLYKLYALRAEFAPLLP
jgi:hypothetical protein